MVSHLGSQTQDEASRISNQFLPPVQLAFVRKSPLVTSDDTFYIIGGEFNWTAIMAENYKLLVVRFSKSANIKRGVRTGHETEVCRPSPMQTV